MDLIRKVPKHAWRRIEEASRVANIPKPADTTKILQCLMAAGTNANSQEMAARLAGLPKAKQRKMLKEEFQKQLNEACDAAGISRVQSSTLSMRFKRGHMARFHDYLVLTMRADYLEARRTAPPDGKVHLAVDVHVKESTGRPPKHGTKTPLHARRTHLTRVTSSNKRYAYGIGFIVAVATWHSQGRRVTMPLLFLPMLVGQSMTPLAQAKLVHAALDPLRTTVAGMLLDRGYDDHRLRDFLTQLGWLVVHRVRVASAAARYFVPKGQEAVDLRQVLTDLEGLEPRATRIRGEGGKWEPAYAFDKILEGHFPDDGGKHLDGVLRCHIIAQRVDGKFVADLSRSCVVFARGIGDLHACAAMYRERWSVEVTLAQLLNQKPAPRAKTIQAEVFQFLTLLYCLLVGYMVRLIVLVHSRDGKFLGERIERYSTTLLWRFALGLLPDLPPF